MPSVVSDIVRYRARSVISRYLNQRGEPTLMMSSDNSTGVQPSNPASPSNPDSPTNLVTPSTSPDTEQSTRTRFPPLADDYDIYSLNVIDLLDYLSELSFSRELKLATARCYRRWLAAYLEDENHPDASRVRYWVIPHSPEYYDLLMSATDRLEADKAAAAKRAENKARIDQLDMFSMLSPNNPDTENVASDTESNLATPDEGEFAPFSKDEIMQMMFETQQIKESAPIAEYDYVSSDVADIFTAALTSKTASGKHRYKHGSLAAALFTGTIMLGLRPREWQHATYHESFTDPFTLLTLGPVVEVFTLKQQRRRDDNPLREKRLLVLDQLRKPELALIKGLLTVVHSHDDNIDKMLDNVRMTLNTAWKRLVKEGKVKPTNKIKKKGRASDSVGSTEISDGYGVNLYTARHIFAEEVKRSGLYTRFELAAMIGHTTTVNQRYYTLGRKYILKTYPHTLPRPWPGDAADIEQWCNDTLSTLSANDIERLRSDGVFYPESNTKDELERVDSLEDFFNR